MLLASSDDLVDGTVEMRGSQCRGHIFAVVIFEIDNNGVARLTAFALWAQEDFRLLTVAC